MRDDDDEPEEVEPEELFDDPLEEVAEFGEADEVAQKEEWEEDALEGGE